MEASSARGQVVCPLTVPAPEAVLLSGLRPYGGGDAAVEPGSGLGLGFGAGFGFGAPGSGLGLGFGAGFGFGAPVSGSGLGFGASGGFHGLPPLSMDSGHDERC